MQNDVYKKTIPIHDQGKGEISILVDLLKYKPSIKRNIKDIKILRDLAKRIKEVSCQDNNTEKIKIWKKHNSLEDTRPIVINFPENAFEEIIPYSSLKAENNYLREYEWYLRSNICHYENFQDDFVITDTLKVPVRFEMKITDVSEIYEVPDEYAGTARFLSQISEESDIEKIINPCLIINKEETNRDFEYLSDIFGDILNVKIYWTFINSCFNLTLIDHFSKIRGTDKLLYDYIDRPQWVHKVMTGLSEASLKIMKIAEKNNWLGLNNCDDYIGSGSLGWTNELPQKDFRKNIRLKDLWGAANSQDVTSISPQMFQEFILPYQKKLLDNYGLVYYGCCENLKNKYSLIKSIKNLIKISISPFTDLREAVSELGDEYILSWKPNPSYLAMENFDDDLIRKYIKNAIEIMKDCKFEVVMKDTHTIRGDAQRIQRWTKIVKGLILN